MHIYCTKWVEAKAIKNINAKSTTKFIYENIITRFNFSYEIVSDWGTHSINETIGILLAEFMVVYKKSKLYYPQTNLWAESTNKTLVAILTKTC